jgi:RNA polymerase sigma-70 factor (ECF subfamily)
MTDREGKTQTKGVELARATKPRPSLHAIFEAEASYVGVSLRRLGVRERDLEDLTHDVFVIVHKHLEDYDPERHLRPWLFGIAVRVALGYRRRAAHHLELVKDTIEAADPAPLADEQLDAQRARSVVLRALDDVPLERRSVFILHDIDGIAMPEIAQVMSVPLNTGYSRLRHARAEFNTPVQRILAGKGER